MEHASQSRPSGLAGALGRQQRGHDVPRNRALSLREIDQQGTTIAQVQLDRAVVTVDLRETERLKRERSHAPFDLSAPRGTRRGRCVDSSQA